MNDRIILCVLLSHSIKNVLQSDQITLGAPILACPTSRELAEATECIVSTRFSPSVPVMPRYL